MSQKGSKRERRKRRAAERQKLRQRALDKPATGRGPRSIRKAFLNLLKQAKRAG